MEYSPEAHNNPEINLKKIHSIISNAPELIEEEMGRGTDNPWFACVDTQLQALIFLVDFAQEDGEIDGERAEALVAKIRNLSKVTKEYQRQYPTKNDVVPPELKEEMYRKLNIFAE